MFLYTQWRAHKIKIDMIFHHTHTVGWPSVSGRYKSTKCSKEYNSNNNYINDNNKRKTPKTFRPQRKRMKIQTEKFPPNLWFIDFLGIALPHSISFCLLLYFKDVLFSVENNSDTAPAPSCRLFFFGAFFFKQVFENEKSWWLRARIRLFSPYKDFIDAAVDLSHFSLVELYLYSCIFFHKLHEI